MASKFALCLLLTVPVFTASALYTSSLGSPLKSSYATSTLIAARIVMYEKQDVEHKMEELRASWQRSSAQAPGNVGKVEPSEEQLQAWAEEALAADARAKEVMQLLEAELAASDAAALEYWNSPEMVAARETKAAEAAEEKCNGPPP